MKVETFKEWNGFTKLMSREILVRTVSEEIITSWPNWKQNLLWRIGYLLTKFGLSRKIALILQGFLLFGILPMISKKKIMFDFPSPGSGGSMGFFLWSLW